MRLATLALFALAVTPAHADEAKPVETAWSLFATHCVKFLEADTIPEIKAAFAPYKIEITTTTDGAMLSGGASLDDVPMPDEAHISLNIFTTRLDGGVLRNCTLHVTGGSDVFKNFASFAQERAGDIIGEGHVVKGGYVASLKGQGEIALHFSMPGFPPEKSMNVSQTAHFRMISLHSATAE